MTLKYVGQKPIISHTGIEFDKNKEDKYVYLPIVAKLLKALDHKYIEDKSYVCEADKDISTTNMMDILEKYCFNLKTLLDKTNHNVEEEIQHNLQRANENDILNAVEKEVFINNIELMHNYMLQRSVNKSVYYCAMKALADIVKKDHIDHITTPFFQTYMHVLHSLQGTLLAEKFPIDTALDVFGKDKQLFIKLKIVNILL